MNSHLKELEEKIQYQFQNKNLFCQALTHSSYANEHRLESQPLQRAAGVFRRCGAGDCNQRLSYTTNMTDLPEGDLTKIRASIVCEPTLAYCAGDIESG